MDKEQLLGYFTSHYLSRREVLFRLPLNISIGTFWPELLNRRKASATVLPLYDGNGKPYWYVLTDKMIEASEKLCAQALRDEEPLDPYKPVQNAGLNEEIFATSFVEGAQVTRSEAMNFLIRNTEPENIVEQMLLNNKKAYTAVLNSLYMPMDEPYMKNLACMLTEEMETQSEGYRQEDFHTIPAMNGEAYDVPQALVLPDRMNDFYAFLSSPDVHPLIKAAVAQGYILVTRPFPEGNERLSRIISHAILLRSGYGFFRDISISAAIARENYGYYKSMCEIIRSENGGDLTYFVEFYLTCLVRAIELKKEHERKKEAERLKREQETIAREQALARQPLARAESVIEKPAAVIEENSADSESPQTDAAMAAEDTPNPISDDSPPGIEAMICKMESVRHSSNKEAAVRVRKAISDGMFSFTTDQWSEHFGIPIEKARAEMALIHKYGLTGWKRIKHGTGLYTIKTEPEAERKEDMDIESALKQLLIQSKSEVLKVSVRILREMLQKGIESFDAKKWHEMSGVIPSTADGALEYAVDLGLVTEKSKVYTICKTVTDGMRSRGLSASQRDFIEKLYLNYRGAPFTTRSAIIQTGYSKSFVHNQVRRFTNRMLIEKISEGKNEYLYRLKVIPECNPECFPAMLSRVYSGYASAQAPMIAMGG